MSFEEGLAEETKHIGCLLYALDEMRIVINNQGRMISCIIGKNPFEDKLNEASITSNISSMSKCCQIFGRPITICEIVDVLDCLEEKMATHGKFVYYTCRKIQIFFNDESLQELYKEIMSSQTYYLHEQPIEVQEKISNLF